jgi:hypothetical protein
VASTAGVPPAILGGHAKARLPMPLYRAVPCAARPPLNPACPLLNPVLALIPSRSPSPTQHRRLVRSPTEPPSPAIQRFGAREHRLEELRPPEAARRRAKSAEHLPVTNQPPECRFGWRPSHHHRLLLCCWSLDSGRLTLSPPMVSISLSSPSSPLPLVLSNRSPSYPGAVDWIE